MKRDRSLIPLSRDHHHALALCVAVGRALAADPSEENAAAQGRVVIREFESRILEHFQSEEQVLFPVLAELPALAGLVAELTGEHRQLVSLIDSVRSSRAPDRIEEFCALLRQHVRKEENVLFEEAQRLLTREQLDQLDL